MVNSHFTPFTKASLHNAHSWQ